MLTLVALMMLTLGSVEQQNLKKPMKAKLTTMTGQYWKRSFY
jgi:hypothetical protein